MSDRDRNQSNKQQGQDDQLNNEVQEELRREAQEGRDDVGQVGENRNVTGSSTWETIKRDGGSSGGSGSSRSGDSRR